MAAIDFDKSIFYQVSDGKIVRQHRAPIDGVTVARVNKNNKTVHEQFFRGLKGRLVDISVRDGEYGKSWMIKLDDGSGTTEVLQLQYSSGYTMAFLKALPNVDLTSDVTLTPKMEEVDGKKKTTLFITQHGQPIKWAYTKDNPGGLPPLRKQKVKGKEQWDDSDQMEFFEAMVKNEIVPQLRKGRAAAKAEPQYADDLPFDQDTQEDPF